MSWKVDRALPTRRMGLFAEEYSACKYCTVHITQVHTLFASLQCVQKSTVCTVQEERLRLQNQQTDLLSTCSFAFLLLPCSCYAG